MLDGGNEREGRKGRLVEKRVVGGKVVGLWGRVGLGVRRAVRMDNGDVGGGVG